MIRHIVSMFLGLAISGSAIASPIIFDSFDGGTGLSARTAGTSPGILVVSVAQPTVIDQIAVLNQLGSDGNLKFLIFDHATHDLLFQSAPQAFEATTESTWKLSDPFSFTLLPGNAYDIGAIADVAAFWNFDLIGNSQNGITTEASNPSFSNFDSPTVGGHGTADGAVRLYGSVGTHTVPETASTLALLVLAMAGLGLVRRRLV